jgi:hypothetical protein
MSASTAHTLALPYGTPALPGCAATATGQSYHVVLQEGTPRIITAAEAAIICSEKQLKEASRAPQMSFLYALYDMMHSPEFGHVFRWNDNGSAFYFVGSDPVRSEWRKLPPR